MVFFKKPLRTENLSTIFISSFQGYTDFTQNCVKFLFLGALGQRETRCWSLCKGLIYICHEQCWWFRQDNDNREQKSWVCYLTLPNINIQILNILLFLFPLVQTMRICWTMVLAIWTWRALMWLQKLQDQFSECIMRQYSLLFRGTGTCLEWNITFSCKAFVQSVPLFVIIGSVGATNMNERSSRSHAIFTITVECSEKGPDGQNHVRMGKLHLVDLAVSLLHGWLDWTYSNSNLLYVSRKFRKTVTIIYIIKVLQSTNHMGRAFNTRKKEEYSKNVKMVSKGSRIVNHAWSHNHTIGFENAFVIDNGGLRTRKTLKA